MKKNLWTLILFGLITVIMVPMLHAEQTDNRVPSGTQENYILPFDLNSVPITQGMTYINGYFHYDIGTFNVMYVDTLNDVSAIVDTILLPSGASRAFVIRNFAADSTFEYWLDNDEGDHRFIKPGYSQYIPCSGSTLFVKTVATPPDLLIEFGK